MRKPSVTFTVTSIDHASITKITAEIQTELDAGKRVIFEFGPDVSITSVRSIMSARFKGRDIMCRLPEHITAANEK